MRSSGGVQNPGRFLVGWFSQAHTMGEIPCWFTSFPPTKKKKKRKKELTYSRWWPPPDSSKKASRHSPSSHLDISDNCWGIFRCTTQWQNLSSRLWWQCNMVENEPLVHIERPSRHEMHYYTLSSQMLFHTPPFTKSLSKRHCSRRRNCIKGQLHQSWYRCLVTLEKQHHK